MFFLTNSSTRKVKRKLLNSVFGIAGIEPWTACFKYSLYVKVKVCLFLFYLKSSHHERVNGAAPERKMVLVIANMFIRIWRQNVKCSVSLFNNWNLFRRSNLAFGARILVKNYRNTELLLKAAGKQPTLKRRVRNIHVRNSPTGYQDQSNNYSCFILKDIF